MHLILMLSFLFCIVNFTEAVSNSTQEMKRHALLMALTAHHSALNIAGFLNVQGQEQAGDMNDDPEANEQQSLCYVTLLLLAWTQNQCHCINQGARHRGQALDKVAGHSGYALNQGGPSWLGL